MQPGGSLNASAIFPSTVCTVASERAALERRAEFALELFFEVAVVAIFVSQSIY